MSRQPQQPPLSYKTVPGRHRTQKWQQAKAYDYSGDDWGGYDDYGGYEEEPQQQQPPAQYPPSASYAAREQPPPAPFGRSNRQNSFDVGEERRAFSAGTQAPPGGFYGAPGRDGTSPARSAASSGGRSEERRPGTGRGRDFTNPESVPAPLNMGMRGSPGPAPAPGAGTAPFPPRGSSMSRGSPAPDAVPSVPKPTEKELPTPPFVRPSDIYRRMEAEKEKERQSQDSSRPSMDSIQRAQTESPASSSKGVARPLSSVEEKSPQIPQGTGSQKDTSPSLPPIQQFGGFGSEMFPQSSSSAAQEQASRQAPPLFTQQISASSSLQATPTATRAPPGSDPAAEILAERSHPQPVSSIGRQPDDLPHQPSSGYRSVVNKAFDRPDDQTKSVPPNPIPANRAISRDNSQSATSDYSSNISRSNTDSTSNISPIMSRVPSAATAQQRQQGRDISGVSTIAEEPRSAGHSREVSSNAELAGAAAAATAAIVPPGYRRSLDPPSSDNSPARTPGMETAERRFSEGLSAEHFSSSQAGAASEPPAVRDQGVEMMPALEPTAAAETPAEELSSINTGMRTGRARAGTDYSLREADLAQTVNLSPSPDKSESFSPVPEAEQAEQQRDLFMQTRPTHSSDSAADFGRGAAAVAAAGTSGRISPSKGRVRDLADKYDAESRRNSQASIGSTKSSWSRFGGSEENLPLSETGPKRQGTGQSNVASEKGDEALQPPRPVMGGREQSFRPQLPGGWVSYQGAPGAESPAPRKESTTEPVQEEEDDNVDPTPTTRKYSAAEPPPDLTPTTKKYTATPIPLTTPTHPSEYDRERQESTSSIPDLSPTNHSPNGQPSSSFVQRTKTAGEALGASLMAGMGLGHQTRDFASKEPVAPPVEVNKERLTSGEFGYMNAKQRPELLSRETGESVATVGTDMSESESTSAADDGDEGLRRDILRSLDSPAEDRQRTQDALDAPDNMRRVEQGKDALPAAEMKDESPSKPAPLRSFLDQRFSWENQGQGGKGLLGSPTTATGTGTEGESVGVSGSTKEMFAPAPVPAVVGAGVHAPTPILNVPPKDPEVLPEMPYERPRSRGLHIMNADEDSDADDESPQAETRATAPPPTFGHSTLDPAASGTEQQKSLLPIIGGPVSPITKSQENLHARSIADREAEGGSGRAGEEGGVMRELAPSPLSENGERESDVGRFLPSYYTMDPPAALKNQEQEELRDDDGAAQAPEAATTILPAQDTEKEVEPSKDGPIPITPPPEPPIKDSTTATSPSSPTEKAKIPPFREILAIKTPETRIQTYDSTRRTFAEMDTGLSGWLSQMLDQHPEHASLPRNPAAASTGSWGKGHRSSPSIANRLALPRFNTGTASNSNAGAAGVSGSDDGPVPEVPPKTPGGGTSELQQKGKDLMKGAGVLGGKAQAGAKGLLAKGRSRFGTQRESRGGSGSGGGGKVVPIPKDIITPSSCTTTSNTFAKPPPPSPADAVTPTRAQPADTSIVAPALAAPAFPALLLEHPNNNPSAPHSASPSPSPRPGPSPLLKAAFAPPVSLEQSTIKSTPIRDGRPLSRTFERLREKSRSLSRGVGGSRPPSLVLNTGGTTSGQKDGVAAAGGDAAVGRDAAISPWQEPDEFGGLDGLRSVTPLPERLGVLPSPGAETFEELPGELRGDAAVKRNLSIDAALLEKRQEQELDLSNLESKETPAPEMTMNVDRALEQRPVHERKVSDLMTLPSRIKSFESPNKSMAAELEENEDNAGLSDMALVAQTGDLPDQPKGDDELYKSTPVSAKQPHIISQQRTQDAGDSKDEDLYESTPVAVAAKSETPVWPQMTREAEYHAEEELYESTPVAEKQSWKQIDAVEEADQDPHAVAGAHAISRDHDPDDALPTPQASVPSDAQHVPQRSWDKRSEVSSNNDFKDARDGLETDDKMETPSRHSSVSSLEHVLPIGPMPVQRELTMSSRAVTADSHGDQNFENHVRASHAAPVDSVTTSHANTAEYGEVQNRQHAFTSRPYNHHVAQPMSYVPSGLDSSALPMQHRKDRGPASTFMDLSRPSRPYDSGATFIQHSSSVIAKTNQSEGDSSASKSRRFSGLFRGRDSQPRSTISAPVGLPPRLITDSYGLEGLQHDAEDVSVYDDRSRRQQATSNEIPERRKSGIWETFKRSPSASTKDASRESSLARLDPTRQLNERTAEAPTARPIESRNTLKKIPQRTTSAAVQAEPKNKRLSRLGSLFGRSSTTVHKVENPRKLMKIQTPSKEDQHRRQPPLGSGTTGYESYEAQRRQQIPDFRHRQSAAYPSPTLPNVSLPDLSQRDSVMKRRDVSSPPLEGWYASQAEMSTAQPRRAEDRQLPPRFRRMHSDRSWHEPQHSNMPENSRPSFDGLVPSSGPSPGYEPSKIYSPPTRSTLPTYQSAARRRPSLSNQGAPYDNYQPEQARSEWHRRAASLPISSIQPETVSEKIGAQPLGENIARSPDRDYIYQRNPYAIGTRGDVPKHSRAASWEQSGLRQASQPEVYVPSGGYEVNGRSPTMGMYQDSRVTPLGPRSPCSSLMAHAPMYGERPPVVSAEPGAYPSPPHSPDTQLFHGPQLNGGPPKRQPPRYYAQPGANQRPSPVPFKGPYNPQRQSSGGPAPLSHQRMPSGFSGRRDDPAVGEDALGMLGVNYPGQELTADRWN